MPKIKRIISLFLAVLLLVTVCGCKKQSVNSDESSIIEEVIIFQEEESSCVRGALTAYKKPGKGQ